MYQGLKEMLDYTEDNMEEVFMQSFQICHRDVFGNVLLHNLKENGDRIPVSQENKRVIKSNKFKSKNDTLFHGCNKF